MDLLYKFLEYSGIISPETLDKLIETATNKNSAEAASVLLEYKNKNYPPSALEELSRKKIESVFTFEE